MYNLKGNKAQGLSINLVILVVIGLIVLLIVALTVTGKWKILGQKTNECVASGGTCRANEEPGETKVSGVDSKACPEGQSCYRYNYG